MKRPPTGNAGAGAVYGPGDLPPDLEGRLHELLDVAQPLLRRQPEHGADLRAVDAVGGDTLAWLTRTMQYGGAIACSGLTGGTDLRTTVLPFILRGVKLLGIDSVMCPMEVRREVWRRLAADVKPAALASMTREIGLDDLPGAFATLLRGGARGRFVVKL